MYQIQSQLKKDNDERFGTYSCIIFKAPAASINCHHFVSSGGKVNFTCKKYTYFGYWEYISSHFTWILNLYNIERLDIC